MTDTSDQRTLRDPDAAHTRTNGPAPVDPLDPTPDASRALTVADPAAPPVVRDAHGFDPNDYDWLPVPRQRRRADGWSAELQRKFIQALADTGSITDAAREVEMSTKSCYALRRSPDAIGFARAWDAAMDQAGRSLLDLAFERVIHGEDIPILNNEGKRIGGKRRYSDRMMMFLLRGFFPERFGVADERSRRTLTRQPEVPLVEAALAALEPVTPADPHVLMPPEELAEFIAAEDFDAAEEERFQRLYPDAEAHAAAAREARADPAFVRPKPPGPAPEPSWEYFAEQEAAAQAKREARNARRRKY